MNVLVFNCGSSSLNYKVFELTDSKDDKVILSGKAHRIGVIGTESSFIEHKLDGKSLKVTVSLENHSQAASLIIKYIREERNIDIGLIGHRFVHSGGFFDKSAFIDSKSLKKLRQCLPFAPIHNPISLNVIDESIKAFPQLKQYVAFDSAFHSTIPPCAYTYPLPEKILKKFRFRKYGFHGLSYLHTMRETARFLQTTPEKLKIVACHLGTGGSSVAAIKNGRSIDTSMGFSPLTGLAMSTRCGDIDPMLTIYLMSVYGYRADEMQDVLERKSGLLGVSGFSSDIRDIINFTSKGEKEQAELALNMYVHRIKKYIGGYVVIMGGIDALVFTDDIGVTNWLVREKICNNMDWCGVNLDGEMNRKTENAKICRINKKDSKTSILSIPPDEERIIFLEGVKLLEMLKEKSR
ncbi:MAG: acetate/propionate family kinase [Sedimentisphaerales bacterium]